MGIRSMFGDQANFSEFTKSTKLKINDIAHMAKIDINEDGSYAYESCIGCFQGAIIRAKQFKCDHPFMFVVHDEIFNGILFAGIYRGKSQEN